MVTQELLQQLELVPDEDLVPRILAGETALFELLMRRHNQQVYRAARAIVRNEAEAEDVMQDAYVRAFHHLDQFEGRAKFSTWLLRIAVNEALARRRKDAKFVELDPMFENSPQMTSHAPGPESSAARNEVRALLQDAIDHLPEPLRLVLMLRHVEELSTAETAAVLEISEENVKIRTHRAKAALRETLLATAGEQARHLYTFGAARCDRMVAAVFERIAKS